MDTQTLNQTASIVTNPSHKSPYYDDGQVTLWHGDARQMDFVPDGSVNLVVTSPPYNAGIEYTDHDDLIPISEHLDFSRAWLSECYRVLKNTGRICVNVAAIGRNPYIPYHHFLSAIMVELGFTLRGERIWEKTGVGGNSTAWGSYMSQSAPVLRDVHEYIITATKGDMKLEWDGETGLDLDSEDDKRDFMDGTRSVWKFNAQIPNGHPAPFPEELPRRLIKLYSYVGDTVLDPFSGSGTTAWVAKKLHRKAIGVDNSLTYLKKSAGRISQGVML